MSLAYLLNWYPQPSLTPLRCEMTALEEMGIPTGIDLEQLIESGRRAEQILGQRLRSGRGAGGRGHPGGERRETLLHYPCVE